MSVYEAVRRFTALPREVLTRTVQGREVLAFRWGRGARRVLITAGHHGNESITSLLILRFLQDISADFSVFPREKVTLFAVPLVNPDGAVLAEADPDWKANALGVDLNLNYPARWELAKQLKAQEPGARDYPGAAPLDQRETAALAAYTRRIDPQIAAAWHTQGGEIYGPDDDFGQSLARASGYVLTQPPEESRNAGFRDWFEQEWGRPAYTIEAGRGVNPLPLTMLKKLYEENQPILVQLLMGSVSLL